MSSTASAAISKAKQDEVNALVRTGLTYFRNTPTPSNEDIRQWVDTQALVQTWKQSNVRERYIEAVIGGIRTGTNPILTTGDRQPVPEPTIVQTDEPVRDAQGEIAMGNTNNGNDTISPDAVPTTIQPTDVPMPDAGASSSSSAVAVSDTVSVGASDMARDNPPKQLAGYPYRHEKELVEKHGIPLRRRRPNEGAWTGAKRPRYPAIHRPFTNNTRAHIIGNRSAITRMHTLGYDQDIVRSHPVPPFIPPHAALGQRGSPEVLSGIHALHPGSHHWLFG